ncbi:MAG: GerMN domain-containing protein [Defluviitaleaceae bacterium]|nr:GerMN domain-containing protein [Defluviitaleaceae bacterium]
MRIEYAATFVLIVLVLFIGYQVSAQSANIYNVSFDESGEVSFSEIQVELPETSTPEEYAAALLEALFDKKYSPNFAPPGTQILTLIINDNHLILNLSKEILSFGEAYYEDCLRRQIVKTALEVPGIDTVTVLVDNSRYFRFRRG